MIYRMYRLYYKILRAARRIFIEPIIRHCFKQCGKPVRIPKGCSFSGLGNISVGNHVYLGADTRILTTKAHLIVGNYVMFGPGVSIVTGSHTTDVIGKYMCEVTDREKHPEDDQDVVIEDDVWIGANATILKGVTIGKGSVVAAGAVVTKSCPPYSIIGGVPARVIKMRFTPDEIEQHEALLDKKA